MNANDLNKEERKALEELWYACPEAGLHFKSNLNPVFPGAVGRVGAKLVGYGLASRLGLRSYGPSARYTAYALTESGKVLAKSLFGVSRWLER